MPRNYGTAGSPGEIWLAPCRLATGNHALSGLAAIDGVTPVAGDRIACFFQTTTTQNGIYVAASGAWSRASDANTAASMAKGVQVITMEGNDNQGKVWRQLNTFNTLGTDSTTWRVTSVVDVVNAFSYPPPSGGIGHTVFDTLAGIFKVWSGSSWQTGNGVSSCTSTTRPGYPAENCIIYETDTRHTYMRMGSSWVPLYEVAVQAAQPTDVIDLWVDTDDVGTPATGPLGSQGYAEITTNSANTATSNVMVDITGLSLTINTVSGRRYKITGQAHVQSTVANDTCGLAIREGSTNLMAMTLQMAATAARPLSLQWSAIVTPTAGAHTYKVGMSRPAGTGTLTMIATATGSASYILIEDIGT